ncbi:hypothetical protein KP509_13G004500 [Ceratopteris richardii]|uniref:Cytochrome P450 n=1 Tax=Ceratopteris richardii TaxID=49495 RepID=A0A8T2TCP5_CERRI|nr:hypothetical protein KP509_13G004500 [Ceratopteris richardii]
MKLSNSVSFIPTLSSYSAASSFSLTDYTTFLRTFSSCSSTRAASNVLSLALLLLLLVMAMWVLVGLIMWHHPGGSAWGLYSLLLCWKTTGVTASNPRIAAIPGPRGFPFLGSLLDFVGRNGCCPHRRLASLASYHGARSLMAFTLGYTRVVVSSHPSTARRILCSPAFIERPLTESARQLLFDRAIGFCPSGERWRSLRRLSSSHLFCPRRIAAHEPIRQADCAAMLDAMVEELAGTNCSVLQVRRYLQHAALNNIMAMVFGKWFAFTSVNGDGPNEAAELQRMVREGFGLLGAFNITDHLNPLFESVDPLNIRQRCAALVPKVFAYVNTIIEEHRDRHTSCRTSTSTSPSMTDASDFVDVLLARQGEEKFSDSDMVSILWEMIFRGTDTMAILTEWIMAELVLNQEMQEKLYKEIVETVGGGGNLRDVDAVRMPYLQALVKEGLRVHMPGPLLSWARLAVHDTEVGGFLVPAGTTAMVNMWAITHDDNIWVDAERFQPERFLTAAEQFEVRGGDMRLAPFGAGARACPGRALAMATVSMWVARIVQRFRVEEHPSYPVRLDEVLKLSCEMETPLVARFVLRENAK